MSQLEKNMLMNLNLIYMFCLCTEFALENCENNNGIE